MHVKEKRLTSRDHLPGGIREMLVIALPMMISHACDTIMTFTDRMFLSRLGPEMMNAAMSGGMTSLMMMTFFMGLIGYSTALVAQYLGANRKHTSPVVTAQVFLVILVAYPLILLLKPLASRFFVIMHIPDEQLAPQMIYFNIMIFGTIIGLLRTALSSYFSGIGKTRIVMIAAILSMIVNVGVNYVLIFGKFGVAPMGIRGAAIGTIIGGVSGLLVLIAAYLGRANRLEFNVMQSFRYYPQIMKKLLSYGYPAGLEFMFNFFAFNLMILIFHSAGSVTATATTIMFNWDMVSYVPLIGIEVAVTSLVGRYMGAGDTALATKSALSGLKTGAFYSVFILILFVFFTEQLVLIFRPATGSDIFDQAFPTAVFMLRVASIYVLVEAAIAAFVGALRGAGDTRWSMVASVILHYSMLLVSILVFKVFHLSAEIAWIIVVFLFMLFSVVFYLRFRSGKWKKIRIVEQNPEV